ncbi:hypothetical protein KIPB_015958, partial [Kipferlia bialata]|eukprot:g15958.t1
MSNEDNLMEQEMEAETVESIYPDTFEMLKDGYYFSIHRYI